MIDHKKILETGRNSRKTEGEIAAEEVEREGGVKRIHWFSWKALLLALLPIILVYALMGDGWGEILFSAALYAVLIILFEKP